MTGRDAALKALIACRRDGAWSDGALKTLLHGMDRREAALASRLCYGVLQNQMLIEFWLQSFVKGKLQPVVKDILLLAVYQLKFMDKIPATAAVNEAVEQAKRHANVPASRLVNGVLRSMLRAGELPMPTDLSTRYSHPKALTALLVQEYGEAQAEQLLQCHNEPTDTVLQVNTLLATTRQVTESLEAAGGAVQCHPWLPDCLSVRATGSMESLEPFEKGWIYAQDGAARLAVYCAGLKSGMRVLDCCAAPGGKSFAAAIAMNNQGELVSCDIHPHKLTLIENGARRLGISILSTCLQDASKLVEAWKESFDTVLADVPCSGLGVIRKKPDIRYKDLSPTEKLPALQLAILCNQAAYVKKGGVLVYSTCTILRRENQQVVEQFLLQHSEFSLETMIFPENSGIAPMPMCTLLPSTHGTDGFFICKFRRNP